MEPTLMLRTSSVLILVTALGGLAMATIRLGGKRNPPAWLAMLHGFLAATGVTLLAYAYFTAELPPLANLALLLFLVAALGGVAMNRGYQLKAAALPIWLLALHATVAAIAFVLLVVAAWGA